MWSSDGGYHCGRGHGVSDHTLSDVSHDMGPELWLLDVAVGEVEVWGGIVLAVVHMDFLWAGMDHKRMSRETVVLAVVQLAHEVVMAEEVVSCKAVYAYVVHGDGLLVVQLSAVVQNTPHDALGQQVVCGY